jgi:uncharacterized protein YPO0396
MLIPMSRKISLSRIHAINWYGYSDSFAVTGNLLIAGITGSGKSALMDLIQLVLVGDQRAKYNTSATGKASTRNLKSYCLGDTKEEIDGIPQYMRPEGAVTYAALEFTWPDGRQAETWGLRIEFASAAQQSADTTPFFLPEGVGREFFLDADNCPLDATTFELRVKSSAGQVFRRLDEYRETMSHPPHLNFDRAVIDHLLPQAMSFTFLKSFDDHCRNFVLPAELLDIQPLSDSYRAFRGYEKDITLLNEQKERLVAIAEVFAEAEGARRDILVWENLVLEWTWQMARERAESATTAKGALEVELAEQQKRLVLLGTWQTEGQRTLTALRDSLHQMPSGDLYLHLKDRNKELVVEIERLKGAGTTVTDASKNRARLARQWLASLRDVETSPPHVLLNAIDQCAAQLANAGVAEASTIVGELAAKVGEALQALDDSGRPWAKEVNRLETELSSVRKAIGDLEANRPPESTPLLDYLNTHLPRGASTLPAQSIRDLCEVADELWRPALEVAFARKYAIVVEKKDYDQAERLYYAFKGDSARESLIDPEQALALGAKLAPGSLAEKLKTNHPVAAAVIAHLLGDIRCVKHRDELRSSARTILPDGFGFQRPFVQRRAHYNGLPVIGRRGLTQQLEFQRSREQELRTELAPYERRLKAVQRILAQAKSAQLDQVRLDGDIAEAQKLPDRTRELDANIAKLEAIEQRSALDEKEAKIRDLERRLQTWREEENSLRGSGRQQDLVRLTNDARKANERVTNERGAFDKFLAQHDISTHAARVLELRAVLESSGLSSETRLNLANERWEQAKIYAPERTAKLEGLRREFGALWNQKFHHLDISAGNNAAYQTLLDKVASTDLPHFAELAQVERQRWHTLFRQQVLEKLSAALKKIEREIQILTNELRTPIGNNRYRITYQRNPDFKVYHSLMELSAQHHEDELFFSSVDGPMRLELETFLQMLIERPNDVQTQRLLDYRCYYTYDMQVEDLADPEARPSSVDKHAGKFSGGENQSPYFVAILASYLRAFRRHEQRRGTPSLALVPIDEAFSKLSGERIEDCIQALRTLDLQGVFSMSSGNIPYALGLCDWFLFVTKRTTRVGNRKRIRNIAVSLAREAPEARELVEDL